MEANRIEKYEKALQKNKYRLIRNTGIVAIASAAFITFSSYNNISIADNINFDPIYNEEISIDLDKIQEEISNKQVTINNPEIQSILEKELGPNFKPRDLEKITRLQITAPLTNSDLSDLKYLVNLKSLILGTNKFDLEDLKYNQELKKLTIRGGAVSNINDLPNTIERLEIRSCQVSDDYFAIPFNTEKLIITNSSVRNLMPKNYEALKNIELSGNMYIDLKYFEGCKKINNFSLVYNPNVTNAEVLAKFKKTNIELDEYASIWLNNETLSQLNISSKMKNKIKNEIDYLDYIAESINNKYPDKDSKLNAICRFVINKIDHDNTTAVRDEEANVKRYNYNSDPIKYALETDKGICINYAALFQAICNRTNIDTYQLYSDLHTWNAIKDEDREYAIDLWYLDSENIIENNNKEEKEYGTVSEYFKNNKEEKLLFYDFDIDEILTLSHIPNNHPVELYDQIIKLGFMDNDEIIKVKYQNQIFNVHKSTVASTAVMAIIFLMIINFNYLKKKRDILEEKKADEFEEVDKMAEIYLIEEEVKRKYEMDKIEKELKRKQEIAKMEEEVMIEYEIERLSKKEEAKKLDLHI